MLNIRDLYQLVYPTWLRKGVARKLLGLPVHDADKPVPPR